MIISFTNVIGAIRSLGEAAQVITTNLKMWLGFETSEILGEDVYSGYDIEDWSALSNATINSPTTFSTSSTSTGIYKIIITSGSTYKLTIAGTTESNGLQFANPSTGSEVYWDSGSSAGAFSDTAIFTAKSTQIYLKNKTAGETTITTLKIEELTQITPDKSGNNNVGKLFTGKALDFDGVTNEVDVSGFQMSGQVATFAFWIYPRDTSYQFIMDNKLASGNTDRTILALYQTGSESQKFGFFNYGFKQFGTPTQNQWQRVVFRVNATTVECYVDGVKSGSTLALTSPIDLSASVTANIASKSGSGSASNLDAKLSDFQIYNAYWSTDDIAYDYANPQNLVTDRDGTSIVLSNLKAYWAMSEGKGSTAYNSAVALGSDVITDGTFPNSNNWTEDSEWTISGNTLNKDGSTDNNTRQLISSPVGKYYQITYTISNYVKGGFQPTFGYTPLTERNANGTYTEVGQFAETSGAWKEYLRLFSVGDSEYSISNVILKEVSAGTINGATYDVSQPRIPQLGMMNFSNGAVAALVTLIADPNNTSQDILGNAVRDRLNSFNLDGSGYSSVANSSTLQFGTDAFTIQAWIKPFSLAANNRILTKGVTGNGEFMISVGGDNSSARVFAKDSSGNPLDTSNDFSSLTINSWQMITVVIDTPNDQILFYKNDGNVETKTGASWAGNFNSTQPITIGNTSSVSAGQFFDGLVSDALVYDRALTSTEVENNYNAGLSAHTN